MVKLNNGKYMHLGKAKEYIIWRILQNEEEGTEQQQAFVSHIDGIWLDRTDKDCPISYLVDRAAVIASIEATEPVGEYASMLGRRV